jgi:hypothetical protein
MRISAKRHPRRPAPRFDHLETRTVLSHAAAAAAFEAHLVQAEIHQAELTQAAHSAAVSMFQPVMNTYSDSDVFSNYIGGSIGLQAFVDGLYMNVLHRAPDSDGEAIWTGTLESGRFTPYTVVSYFQIAAGGQQLRPSHPPANIYTGYLGGPVGVTAFVDGLYTDVLQRAPDPAGEAYWVNQIERYDLLPAKITFSFLASAEYQSQVNAAGGGIG